MKKRILVFGFICSLLINNITVFAAEDSLYDQDEVQSAEFVEPDSGGEMSEITVKYVQTNYAIAKLSISGSTAESKIVVSAKAPCAIKLTMYLQKKSGSSWVNVKTWSTTYDKVKSVSFTKTTVVSTGTYRTKSVANVNGETIIDYSGTKTK